MGNTRYDYASLEWQFITGDMSVRQLCEQNGINTWSTVNVQARKREWERKRKDYQTKQYEHSVDALAQRRAMKLAQLHDDIVDVMNAAVLKMAADMQDDKDYRVTPSDLVKLIEKFQLLTGGPTNREEHHSLDLHGDLPADLLREIQAAARAAGAGPRSMGQSALPLTAGPRSVN